MRFPVHRRGVASVIGTVFFVVVFMLATGALAYESGLQAQASQDEEAAAQLAAMRSAEDLVFRVTGAGLEASNTGSSSVLINHLVMMYTNGTAYALPVSATILRGSALEVAGLVENATCSPARATCLAKYAQIVSGRAPGSSIGLVSSLGNVFWYAYGETEVDWNSIGGFPAPCPQGESISQLGTDPECTPAGPYTKVITAPAETDGEGTFDSTGLVAPLSNNTVYSFYAFTSISPELGVEEYEFEVHALPPGATLLIACSPMAYPLGGGNQATKCVNSTGTPADYPLAFGVSPPVYETAGIFGAVAMGGSPGSIEIDFGCVANCGSVEINPGSFMVVQASS